jgi:prephenate dehydrogenase
MTLSPHDPPFAQTVAIVGVGLIGGSIAAALKQRKFTGPIIGAGRDRDRIAGACRLGLIDTAAESLADAAREADLIVFCTPVDRIVPSVRTAAASSRPGTLLTDAGSVKRRICDELRDGLPDGVTFIGSHPVAGSDRRGFEHANPALFQGRVCVVTPDVQTPPAAFDRLRAFWQFLGMKVIQASAAEHDTTLARTSHLPHVVAAALAEAVPPNLYELAGTGFRDTTRIAGGSPELWVSILLENAESLLPALAAYGERFEEFRDAISRRDAEQLRKLLENAKANRDALDS